MRTRNVVALLVVWALSLCGVGLWAQAPKAPGGFGFHGINTDNGAETYRGHANDKVVVGNRATYRGNFEMSVPNARFIVVSADEASLDQPLKDGQFDILLTGNVRLKFDTRDQKSN